LEAGGVNDCNTVLSLLKLLGMFFQHVLSLNDDVLPLPVLEQAVVLQSADNVVTCQTTFLAQLFDRSSVLPGIVLEEVRQDYVLPVAAIGDQPKVRERSLGGAHLFFPASEEVAEVNQHAAEALAHVLWQDHNTG